MRFRPIILAACIAVGLAAGPAHAQITSKSSTDGAPCCAIVSIDMAQAVVTARDKAGKTFRFRVADAALLKTLRVGQSVAADFGTGKVTVNGVAPCCAIIKAQADPADPCCAITAINAATGVVTAHVAATRATFSFRVQDAALLRSLKVGQAVFADFKTSKVRIHGSEPCCAIITY
jgi:Cu/Ag efflux protein CusF